MLQKKKLQKSMEERVYQKHVQYTITMHWQHHKRNSRASSTWNWGSYSNRIKESRALIHVFSKPKASNPETYIGSGGEVDKPNKP